MCSKVPDGLRFIVAARTEDDRVVLVEHARPVERGGGVPREEARGWNDVNHGNSIRVRENTDENRDCAWKTLFFK